MTTPDHATTEKEKLEAILDQALKLFMRHGIRSMTMDDVATNLHISKKTLYQYFTDKNDLVERAVARMSGHHTACIDTICEQGLNAIDEQHEIATYLAGLLSQVHPSIHYDLEKYHPRAWLEFHEGKRAHIYGCISRNMQKGIAEGLYRDDLNVDVVAKLYMARFDVLFDGEIFPMDKYSFADITWESFRYHVRGIASDKGARYLERKVTKERANA